MQANCDKFQGLLLGPESLTKLVHLMVKDREIRTDEHVKLLGIHLDKKLDFEYHISELCQKAGNQLNALARISRFLDQDSRMAVFKTFLLSNFNYCPSIWHFCKESSSKQLEYLQERGLRYVYNDFVSSYDSLLDRANLATLHLNRIRAIACETYKIVKHTGPSYNHNLIQLRDSSHNTRGSTNAFIPRVRTTRYGQKSLRFYGSKIWNMLPETFKSVENINEFN